MADIVLEARGIVKSYAHNNPVLNMLDLQVTAGECVALLGPSGSGKSTLLNLLGLMDRPTSGEILLFGQATAALEENERARLRNRRLGFVFQFDSLLPEFTILENVVMPARIAGTPNMETVKARGLELLDGLGLKRLQNRFPAQISGGERQRAALCRALINEPAALLADEPTGNLDKNAGELVFKDLRALADRHGAAVIIVTHNESIGLYARRILRLRDGVIETEKVS